MKDKIIEFLKSELEFVHVECGGGDKFAIAFKFSEDYDYDELDEFIDHKSDEIIKHLEG